MIEVNKLHLRVFDASNKVMIGLYSPENITKVWAVPIKK